jgi:hypothetical protein
MWDLTEQDLAALDPAGYWQDKYETAADEIKRLQARVEALEAWCEQTNQDAYEKWKALEALEATEWGSGE